MKKVVTIESIKVLRSIQHKDGTYGPVYGVKMSVGDDEIIAECWKSAESQKKLGIVPGAIGKATMEFEVSEGVSKAGNEYCIQKITLRDFVVPKRHDNSSEDDETAAEQADAQQKEEKPAEAAQAAEAEASDLPY